MCKLANTPPELKPGLCQRVNEHLHDLSHRRGGDHPRGAVQIVYSKNIEGKLNDQSSNRGSRVRTQVRSAKCSQGFSPECVALKLLRLEHLSHEVYDAILSHFFMSDAGIIED